MPTIFIAVQCCECSTMQVKQSSKSNKWTCVVCNQKQSTRKVFAQSPMARDLRPFVQSSNMARQFNQENPQQHDALVSDSYDCNAQRKRRTDWTLYLDAEDGQPAETKQGEVESGGFEPQIVTELSPELFKKPKLQDRRPVFSKRNSIKHVVSPKLEEDWKCASTVTKNSSNQSHFMMRDDKEAITLQTSKATSTGASKWSAYVMKDDNDGFRSINSDNAGKWSNEAIAHYELETLTTDERVDDDIHPDFLQG